MTKKRRIETRLIETDEVFNFRIIAETAARNILKGAIHNDIRKEI